MTMPVEEESKKVLLIAGSNSPDSINRKLISHTAGLFKKNKTMILDLENYPLPIYNIALEKNEGIPENASKIGDIFKEYDAFVFSVAEHNGSVTAFFKNVLDWLSRTQLRRTKKDYRVLENRPVILISTSPLPGGGRNALSHVEFILKVLSGRIIGTLSIPKFRENTEESAEGIKIKDENLRNKLRELVSELEAELNEVHRYK